MPGANVRRRGTGDPEATFGSGSLLHADRPSAEMATVPPERTFGDGARPTPKPRLNHSAPSAARRFVASASAFSMTSASVTGFPPWRWLSSAASMKA